MPIIDTVGQPGLRRLKVTFTSTHTWAQDEITGKNYEVSEGYLYRHTIDKSYLRERLSELLREQLVDVPINQDNEEPFVLGHYRLGDQRLPVALISRLWEPKHASKMDTVLRQSNLGLHIVLSTSARVVRRFLGTGIVVTLEALALDQNGQVTIDLS